MRSIWVLVLSLHTNLTRILLSWDFRTQRLHDFSFSHTQFHYHIYWVPVAGSRYSDSRRAGRSGDRIPVGARFSAPVQTGPGAHPASYTICTGYFPAVKRLGSVVNHPPTSSAEVKERVEYTSTSLGLCNRVMASTCCGWRRRSVGMEDSCLYSKSWMADKVWSFSFGFGGWL